MSLLNQNFLKFSLVALVTAFSLLLTPCFADQLKPGDKAPHLKVKESLYLSGEPLADWEPGKVTVVEFWGTWCPPCIASIPELAALQEKYKDKLTIIGVAEPRVVEADEKKETEAEQIRVIQDFLKGDVGKKINYRIVADLDDSIYKAWMVASGINSIPTAFVIDQEGKIAFIGRMPRLGEVIPQIVDKTRGWILDAKLRQLGQQQRWDNMVDAIDQELSTGIEEPFQWELTKFDILFRAKKDEAAAVTWMDTLRKKYDNDFGKQTQLLRAFFAQRSKLVLKDRSVLEKIATQVEELRDKADNRVLQINSSIFLANFYMDKGNVEKAIDLLKNAQELLPNDPEGKQTKEDLGLLIKRWESLKAGSKK